MDVVKRVSRTKKEVKLEAEIAAFEAKGFRPFFNSLQARTVEIFTPEVRHFAEVCYEKKLVQLVIGALEDCAKSSNGRDKAKELLTSPESESIAVTWKPLVDHCAQLLQELKLDATNAQLMRLSEQWRKTEKGSQQAICLREAIELTINSSPEAATRKCQEILKCIDDYSTPSTSSQEPRPQLSSTTTTTENVKVEEEKTRQETTTTSEVDSLPTPTPWVYSKLYLLKMAKTVHDYDDGVILLLSKFYSVSRKNDMLKSWEKSFALFYEDYSSRIWLSNRMIFPPLQPGSITDCGWAGSIRSAQMMLAQALIQLHLGRNWRYKANEANTSRDELVHREIVSLFLESPYSPFSLRSLLSGERDAVGKPFTITRALDLIRHSVSSSSSPLTAGITFEHVVDGTVQLSQLESVTSNWTRSLLLAVDVRVRWNETKHVYCTHMGHLLKSSCSLGIVGGRTDEQSVYIIGYHGEEVIYLDPQVEQPPVSNPPLLPFAELTSFHCSLLSKMPYTSLDPLCAIGFLFRDKGELMTTFENLNTAGVLDLEISPRVWRKTESPLFSVSTSKKTFAQSSCSIL